MCNCITQVNEQLKEHNTRVVYTLPLFNPDAPRRVFLQTEKLDSKSRKKPMGLQASYCPFCGAKYVEPEVKPEDVKSLKNLSLTV